MNHHHPLFDRRYSPYSNLDDTAWVLTAEEVRFPGVRIENVSYPLTITGIQAAWACAVSEGFRPVGYDVSSKSEPSVQYLEQFENLIPASGNAVSEQKEFILIPITFPQARPVLAELLSMARVSQSGFRVSALAGNDQDGYVSGVNVETALWSFGLCAERVAIAKAFSSGFRKIETIHIHTEKGSFCSPCGACRQVLFEINPSMKLFLHHPDGSTSTNFARDLLPYSFGLR